MAGTIEAKRSIERGQIVLLKCEAKGGMFAYECAVIVKGCGRRYETMIDKELIIFATSSESEGDCHAQSGWVKVSAISIDEDQRSALVELPRQIVGGGRRITVPLSEIDVE